MKNNFSCFLIVCNGCEENRPALQYGVWLANAMKAHVSLLGIVESNSQNHAVQGQIDETSIRLAKANVRFETQITKGPVDEVLPQHLRREKYDLLMLGPLGRPPFLRWLRGRSFRHILAEITVPILYVPAVRWPIRKILVCMGGLGYAFTVENHAIHIAKSVQAAFTLLHIVPPIDLEYPLARQVQDNWEHLSDTDTLLGSNIRHAIDLAKALNLTTDLKVMHGHIVEEITREVKRGDYDLVCMGSPYSSHGLRHLYTPNVTAEVSESVHVPILAARFEELDDA